MAGDPSVGAIVRPIRLADVAGFHAAVGAVARERRYLSLLDVPSLAETATFVADTLAAGWPQMVAETEGRIVGWCDVRCGSSREVFAHIGVLGIGIVDGYRDRGLGRRLASAAIEAAWAHGFERIELTARADNLRAIALYGRLGFRHEGLKRGSFRVDGDVFDEVLMAMLAEDAASPPAG